MAMISFIQSSSVKKDWYVIHRCFGLQQIKIHLESDLVRHFADVQIMNNLFWKKEQDLNKLGFILSLPVPTSVSCMLVHDV